MGLACNICRSRSPSRPLAVNAKLFDELEPITDRRLKDCVRGIPELNDELESSEGVRECDE